MTPPNGGPTGSEYPRTGIDVLNALVTQPGTLAAYLFSLEGRIAQYTGSVGGSEHGVIDTINYLNQVNFLGPVNLAQVSLPDNIAVDSITPPSGTLTVNGNITVTGAETIKSTDTLLGLLTVNVPSGNIIASFESAGTQVAFIGPTGAYNVGSTTTYADGVITSTAATFSLPGPISVGTNLVLSAFGLSAVQTFTFPNLTDTITTLTAAQTLTNKTLSSPVLSGTIGGTYTIGGVPTLGVPLNLNGQTLSGYATFSGLKIFVEGTLIVLSSGSLELFGPIAGTYTIGGVPTLGSTLNLNGQTLSGNTTFSGLPTFNSGITGTGNTGTLTAGTGIVGTSNTWTSQQTFGAYILAQGGINVTGLPITVANGLGVWTANVLNNTVTFVAANGTTSQTVALINAGATQTFDLNAGRLTGGFNLNGQSLSGNATLNGILTGGTFSGPTLSGTVSGTPIWASAQSFPSPLTVGTNLVLTVTGLTAVRTFTFPDLTDTITTLTAVQTLTNKVFDSASNTLNLNGVRVVVSATPSLGAALSYNGYSWEDVFAGVVSPFSFVNQTASLATTAIYTPATNQLVTVEGEVVVTAGSGSIVVTLTTTEADGGTTRTIASTTITAADSAGGIALSFLFQNNTTFQKVATAITLAVTVTGTVTYTIRGAVRRLG